MAGRDVARLRRESRRCGPQGGQGAGGGIAEEDGDRGEGDGGEGGEEQKNEEKENKEEGASVTVPHSCRVERL
eukprot:751100-Hanusia_phi.AAC.2